MMSDFNAPRGGANFRRLRRTGIITIALTLGLTACEVRTAQELSMGLAEALLGPAPKSLNRDPAWCPEGNPSTPLPPHCIAYPKPGTVYPDKMPFLEGLAWPQSQEDLIGALGNPLTQEIDKLTYRYGERTIVFPCDWQGCYKWEVK